MHKDESVTKIEVLHYLQHAFNIKGRRTVGFKTWATFSTLKTHSRKSIVSTCVVTLCVERAFPNVNYIHSVDRNLFVYLLIFEREREGERERGRERERK